MRTVYIFTIIIASIAMFLIDYYVSLPHVLRACTWLGFIVIVGICSYQIMAHWHNNQ
ncbi:hypothetical protein LBSG162_20990 [Lentilactobacillus buchneri subsp. silagei]|nr:hypothetical protein Ltb232_16950 [Lentilactobacillus buchneri subsp. silagei]GED92994.1 hypothetical protein LBSG162_20990 [Lentilactobacillus buchneri subsp. silagei]GED95286.1 hypothetical protein LBSP_18460 [Lentilactobacillus buchneri subsp. silagei]